MDISFENRGGYLKSSNEVLMYLLWKSVMVYSTMKQDNFIVQEMVIC